MTEGFLSVYARMNKNVYSWIRWQPLKLSDTIDHLHILNNFVDLCAETASTHGLLSEAQLVVTFRLEHLQIKKLTVKTFIKSIQNY